MVETAHLRCAAPSAADRAALKQREPRPWTPERGATIGQLKAAVDRRDVLIERLAAVGARAHSEIDACRSVPAEPRKGSPTS